MTHIVSDKKDPKSPATTSFAWDEMIDIWTLIETVLGGTRSMRAAGQEYLPKHSEETEENYVDRLESNYLFNALALTLDHFVGLPFSDPMKVKEDVPADVLEWLDNIDLQGNNLTVFGRQWFREGLAKGFAHVLIDMPAMSQEERQTRTLADDRREGRRPYWILIRPENVIAAVSEIVQTPDGPREHLVHVRIVETETAMSGFAEVEVERIRVLEPGTWALYEKRKILRKKPEWVLIDGGETGLDFVPLVTFYAERQGLMRAKPPLEDLAHLNVRWWQSNADQINVLTVARFPMLAVSGATDTSGAVMAIGPRQLLGTKDANGKFYYVEHSGKSIAAGRQDLLDIEEQMGNYGAVFLKRRPGNQAATSRALDSAEATSPLQDMVVRFVDSVNNALDVTAKWMKLDTGGTIEMDLDFQPSDESENGPVLELLAKLRKDRDISRKAIIEEAKRRDILGENYDIEKDFAQLKTEDEVLKPLQPQVPGTFDPAEGDQNGSPPMKKPAGPVRPRSSEPEPENNDE